VASPGSDDDRADFIARCGVVIAGSPRWASRLHTPAVAFDAVAIGTPVIVPPGLGISLTLPRMTGTAAKADVARQLIETALRTGEVVPERREAGRISVRNEHTYCHRLATIASALGVAVVPVA
jgi:hypothetical protein